MFMLVVNVTCSGCTRWTYVKFSSFQATLGGTAHMYNYSPLD